MGYNNYYNRILLIGFRCSGKTTLSKELSKILNFECLDVDALIEEEQGCSINTMVENGKNWVNFRKLETLKIKELLNFNNVVIAGGGGLGVNNIPYNESLTFGDLQREIINRSPDTLKILLEASEETTSRRLKIKKRPDLMGQTFNEENYIENNLIIMRERKKYYREMADVIINTDSDDVILNLNKIIDAIDNNRKNNL